MRFKKIAVVGAGICGLYLAARLAQKGFRVTVFERKKEVGKTACSGLFSARILDFIPESKKLIENEIEYVILHFPQKTLKIKFSRKFYVIHHQELDRLAADWAQKAGAEIILGQEIKELPSGFDKIIGCDGAASQVRRVLGLPNPHFFLGIQSFITGQDFSNFVETWATKAGFLWKIPRGREIEYGIMEKKEKAKELLDEFFKKNNIEPQRTNSALIPQGFIVPSHSQITLCGDAAGLTKPWSGGGVIWGLTAANILLKNFPDFLKYKKELRKTFLPKIIFSKTANGMVHFLGFNMPWILPQEYEIESDFLV